MNVKVVGKDLIDYSNLKMMLYEVGLSWDTRHSIVHDHYVWHAGRYGLSLIILFSHKMESRVVG